MLLLNLRSVFAGLALGNHEIECEFCGQDQRKGSGRCCAEYIADEKRKMDEFHAREQCVKEYLAKFGLKTDGSGFKLYTSDVISFLKKNESKLLGDRFNREDPV